MKVPIDYLNCNQIHHVLTFLELFVKDKNLLQTVFRPLVIQFNDTSFRNQYFSVNQSDLREKKKRGLVSYLSA